MLTSNRKRRRSCDGEDDQQAKRSGGCHGLLASDPGRDMSDSESSSSDSSNSLSSPDSAIASHAGPCVHGQNGCISLSSPSPNPEDSSSSLQHGLHGNNSSSSIGGGVSYYDINRVLREAHFSSLQTRGRSGAT